MQGRGRSSDAYNGKVQRNGDSWGKVAGKVGGKNNKVGCLKRIKWIRGNAKKGDTQESGRI